MKINEIARVNDTEVREKTFRILSSNQLEFLPNYKSLSPDMSLRANLWDLVNHLLPVLFPQRLYIMFGTHVERGAIILVRVDWVNECDQETTRFNQGIHLTSPITAHRKRDGNKEPAKIHFINFSTVRLILRGR